MNKKLYVSLTMLLACCTAGLFAGKIHDAVKNEDVELVKSLIKRDSKCLEEINESGETPFLTACKKNNIKIIKLLLSKYKKMALCDKNANVFLPCLAKQDVSKIINTADNKGYTPLYWAWKNSIYNNNSNAIIKLLLINGANPNNLGTEAILFLCWACNHDDIELIYLAHLFCTKETINKTDKSGVTPLDILCERTPPSIYSEKININNKQMLSGQIKIIIPYKEEAKVLQDEHAPFIFEPKIFDKQVITKLNGNYLEIIKLLLDKGADPNKFDRNNISPLFKACLREQLELAKLLISYSTKEIINKANNYDTTALHATCSVCRNPQIIKLLLENDADFNLVDKKGRTPLYLACYNENLEIVKTLLDNGATETINIANNNGETPLYNACYKNNLKMVTLLLDNGAKETINKANNDGKTPLYLACVKYNLEMVTFLLDNGATETINKANDCQTILYWACLINNLVIVKLLLKHCTPETINTANNNGETPLYNACYKNNLNIVELLLKHCTKETINKANNNGETPLYNACYKNNLKMVTLLLDNGATESINTANNNGETPLYNACYKNNLGIVELLLKHCTPETINKANKNGETPLYNACYKNNLKMVTLLLDNGATETINTANNNGETPLYNACYNGNLEIVKTLLNGGAKKTINIADTDGETPLYKACLINNLGIVKLLLKHCAKETINIANNDGKTPLYIACFNNNELQFNNNELKMVKLLLKHCTKETINKAAYINQTPLYIACEKNDLNMVELLLLNGANITQKEPDKKNLFIQQYLKAALKYNLQETIKGKIKYIMSTQNKYDELLFNFLMKYCFAKFAQQAIDNNYYYPVEKITEKTAFFGLYNTLISHETFGKRHLEEVFWLKSKNRTFIEFVMDAINDKYNDFYFAKKYKFNCKFNTEHFVKKMSELRTPQNSNNKNIKPDTTIIFQ